MTPATVPDPYIVLGLRLPPHQKLVLLALALRVHPDGWAPTIAQLAADTELPAYTVREALDALAGAGLIQVHAR